MRRAVLALLLLLAPAWLGAAPAHAETMEELFQQANDRYWKGDFEAARAGYARIVEDFRVDNPEVYFNLANSYARLDRLGSAVLYYKRALACAPEPETREAIDANLDSVRRTLAARHRERMEQNRMLYDESHGAWYDLFHVMSADTLAILLLVLCAALALSLVVARLTRRDGLRRGLRPAAAVLFGVALVAGGLLAGNRATTSTVRLGVVIHPDVRLTATRLPDSASVTLPEGLEVRLLDAPEDGLLRVQLSSGREGFVPESSVKEI